MKKITFAAIYRTTGLDFDPNRIDPGWKPLQINGNDVRFLIDILRSQSTFHDITRQVWRLDFFEASPFRQVLYVSVVSEMLEAVQLDNAQIRKQLATTLRENAKQQISEHLPEAREVVRATFIHTHDYETTVADVLTASQLIRGTNSMQYDYEALERHSDRFIHVDGRGTCLFSPNPLHAATFKRQVILLALGQAYLLAMNGVMNRLAAHCEDIGALQELYKTALVFNAKYFFANPVKVNRYDAFQLWQGVRRCTMIDDINSEVTQQLKSVHQILSQEEDNKQLQAELRLNKRIGWLGVAIGVLSLISLFEITPPKVIEFLQAWWHFFIKN